MGTSCLIIINTRQDNKELRAYKGMDGYPSHMIPIVMHAYYDLISDEEPFNADRLFEYMEHSQMVHMGYCDMELEEEDGPDVDYVYNITVLDTLDLDIAIGAHEKVKTVHISCGN